MLCAVSISKESNRNHIPQRLYSQTLTKFILRVPSKGELHEEWIRILENYCPTIKNKNISYICSEHFNSSDFHFPGTGKKKMLKPGTMPSIFSMSEKVSSRGKLQFMTPPATASAQFSSPSPRTILAMRSESPITSTSHCEPRKGIPSPSSATREQSPSGIPVEFISPTPSPILNSSEKRPAFQFETPTAAPKPQDTSPIPLMTSCRKRPRSLAVPFKTPKSSPQARDTSTSPLTISSRKLPRSLAVQFETPASAAQRQSRSPSSISR